MIVRNADFPLPASTFHHKIASEHFSLDIVMNILFVKNGVRVLLNMGFPKQYIFAYNEILIITYHHKSLLIARS